MIEKKCDCCHNKYEAWSVNQLLCKNCRMYNQGVKRKIIAHKHEIKKLRLKFYGQKVGTERIRYKNEKIIERRYTDENKNK